jgi:hypothetical protein
VDAQGRYWREKVGTKSAAIDLYRKRKNEALEGKKLPEKLRRATVSFAEIAKDALAYSETQKRSYRDDRYRMKPCLLCEDRQGNLVVVEPKKFRAGPSIIDQIQRYMGWIMEHRAKQHQKVRGIVIVGSKDTALEYAAKANPLIAVKVFTIAFP